jgi:hypothetical protein
MMRRWRRIERYLLGGVAHAYATQGFVLKPDLQLCIRSFNGGWQALHLNFVELSDALGVSADVAIRFDAVENIANAASSLLTNKEKAATATMGCELGRLRDGKGVLLIVRSMEEAADALAQFVELINTVGMSYLDRYSDLNVAYEALVQDRPEGWMHKPGHAERAKRVCAMLVVMGRRAEVAGVAREKLDFMASVGDLSRPLFERFLASVMVSGD